jgi:hypothetical protein
MIHLVFSQSVGGCLNITLSNMGLRNIHKVHALWDVFSTGPVKDLHCEWGIKERFQWKHNNFINERNQFEECERNYYQTLEFLDSIPSGESITIWAGENAHEQTGLRYAAALLKEKSHDVFVIHPTKKYIKLFKQPKQFYIPYYSGEIPPDKMEVIYEHSKNDSPLTDHERADLYGEWQEISEKNQILRLWQNERLNGASVEYYDEFISDKAKRILFKNNNEFIIAGRVIGDVIGQIDQTIGDDFIESRLRVLIEKGVLEVEGTFTSLRDYRIRLSTHQYKRRFS